MTPRPRKPRPARAPVYGIVLAAGRSSRMGRSKAGLELEGRTFLDRCVELLREGGCRSVVVVVSGMHVGTISITPEGVATGSALDPLDAGTVALPPREAQTAHGEPRDDVAFAVNPDPASEQIESIRIGLAALPGDAAGAVILPVDAPSVRPGTVRRLLRAFRGAEPGRALVVRPTYRGRPGHPTLFARALFPELSAQALPHGAETVVERHAAERLDISVRDAGAVENVNTPDDYQDLREHS